MKRLFIFAALAPLIAISLTSCTKSGAPSCGDGDVTKTAVELLTKGLPFQYLQERAAVSDCLNKAFMSLDFEHFDTLKVDYPEI